MMKDDGEDLGTWSREMTKMTEGLDDGDEGIVKMR